MSRMPELDAELRAAGIDPEEVDLEAVVKRIKEICHFIGCSGVDPDMCQNRPYRCGTIRKLAIPGAYLCDKCKTSHAMHSVFRDGVRKNICCRCHVMDGAAPADWHPDCMKAYRELQEEHA